MKKIATTDILTKGLLFVRRFLSVSSKVNKVTEGLDRLSAIMSDDLKTSETVEGEEMYFFVIGKATVAPILRKSGTDNKVINDLVVLALLQSIDKRTTHSLYTAITTFATELGAICQTYDDDFLPNAQAMLDQDTEAFQVEDPFYELLIATRTGVPQDVRDLFLTLELPTTLLTEMSATLNQAGFVTDWTGAITSASQQNGYLHFSNSFIGLIMRGARSAVVRDVVAVPIINGPDGLMLNICGLGAVDSYVHINTQLADIRSITREMVAMQSRKTMISRGFVQLEDGAWLKISDTIEEYEKGNSGKTVYRRKNTTTLSGIAEKVSQAGYNKLKTSVSSSVLSHLSAKGRVIVQGVGTAIEAAETIAPLIAL